MDDGATTSEEGFIKQRRNLIVISLIIIFYEMLGIQIKQISFFGNEAIIRNSGRIFVILSIFFFYFSWRYYALFQEIKALGYFNVYRKNIVKHIENFFVEKIKSDFNLMYPNQFIIKSEYKKFPSKGKSYNVEINSNTILFKNSTYTVGLFKGISEIGDMRNVEEIKKITIPNYNLFKIRLKCSLSFILKDKSFTEYIVPILLAIAACYFILSSFIEWLFWWF